MVWTSSSNVPPESILIYYLCIANVTQTGFPHCKFVPQLDSKLVMYVVGKQKPGSGWVWGLLFRVGLCLGSIFWGFGVSELKSKVGVDLSSTFWGWVGDTQCRVCSLWVSGSRLHHYSK